MPAAGFVALPSAARTASTFSDEFATPVALSVQNLVAFVDITANPGGVDTIQLSVEVRDPASGKWLQYALFSVCTAATSATFVKVLSPDAVAAPGGTPNAGGTIEGKVGPVPSEFRVRVIHSAGTSFTYSVGILYA